MSRNEKPHEISIFNEGNEFNICNRIYGVQTASEGSRSGRGGSTVSHTDVRLPQQPILPHSASRFNSQRERELIRLSILFEFMRDLNGDM